MHSTKNNLTRWGVIGCGDIAQRFMSSIAVVDNNQVIACASRSLSKAQEFAETHQIQHSFDHYQALYDCDSVDAVYIATTHNSHFENIVKALTANKHVLCEKPITINAKQAKFVYALAEQKQRLLVEAVWTRFLPAIQMLQQTLADNVIGEIETLTANFSIAGDFAPTHRLRDPSTAGGALLDLGIYPITLANIVFNEAPMEVQSSMLADSTGVDASTFMLFSYQSGGRAMLTCSYRNHQPVMATISGTKGYISVPEFLGAKEFSIHLPNTQVKKVSANFADHHCFQYEIAHFHQCLMQGKTNSDIIPASESITIMQTMDDIRAQLGLRYTDEIEGLL